MPLIFLLFKLLRMFIVQAPAYQATTPFRPLQIILLKKVQATSNYGYMLFDSSMSTNDFPDCSSPTLKTLQLHI